MDVLDDDENIKKIRTEALEAIRISNLAIQEVKQLQEEEDKIFKELEKAKKLKTDISTQANNPGIQKNEWNKLKILFDQEDKNIKKLISDLNLVRDSKRDAERQAKVKADEGRALAKRAKEALAKREKEAQAASSEQPAETAAEVSKKNSEKATPVLDISESLREPPTAAASISVQPAEPAETAAEVSKKNSEEATAVLDISELFREPPTAEPASIRRKTTAEASGSRLWSPGAASSSRQPEALSSSRFRDFEKVSARRETPSRPAETDFSYSLSGLSSVVEPVEPVEPPPELPKNATTREYKQYEEDLFCLNYINTLIKIYKLPDLKSQEKEFEKLYSSTLSDLDIIAEAFKPTEGESESTYRLHGGAYLNLDEIDINKRIEKITDYKRASFDQFKLSFDKSNIKRHNIELDKDDKNWILTKFYGESKNKKHAGTENIEREIFLKMCDKDKITFLLKTLKKLEYLIRYDQIKELLNYFFIRVLKIGTFPRPSHKPPNDNEKKRINNWCDEGKKNLDSYFKICLEFITEKKKTDIINLNNLLAYLTSKSLLSLGILYATFSICKNILTNKDYNFIIKIKSYFNKTSHLDSNNLCSIFNGLENTNIPACNKYILACILSTSLKDNGGVLIKDPVVPIESKVPSWSKCKEYLEQSDFWEIANKDIAETPPIIILTVLLVLRFKITETGCKDADGNSFLEFETVKSWLNDTLLEQLTQEIPNEDERKKIYNNIKNNTKLIEFLNLYLEAVPHEFLNTNKTLKYCDLQRINNLKQVPQYDKNSIRDKLAKAIAKIRIERGLLLPGQQNQLGGGKNNNNLYFHAISHQLYNLNKSLNLNKKIQKGGFDENINYEDGSNLQISLNYLLNRDDMPSYSTALKGLIDTLIEIQPMTSELKEKLNMLLQETHNNEMKAAGLRVLLAHVISLNKDNKDITYDSNTIKKLGDKFGKKIEASKESVSKTIEILKSNLIPLYNSNTGSNLYFVHNPFLHP